MNLAQYVMCFLINCFSVVLVNLESSEIEVKRPQSSATSTHSLYSNSGSVPDVKVFAFDSVYDQRFIK